jgi:hypothetical protein
MSTLEDFPVGSYVRRLLDHEIGVVVNHQSSAQLGDAIGVEIDGETWSGTLGAWEHVEPLDALATLIRTSIQLSRKSASSTFATHVSEEERETREREAQARVTAMWRTFYDIAGRQS